jgi:hypothetical protein
MQPEALGGRGDGRSTRMSRRPPAEDSHDSVAAGGEPFEHSDAGRLLSNQEDVEPSRGHSLSIGPRSKPVGEGRPVVGLDFLWHFKITELEGLEGVVGLVPKPYTRLIEPPGLVADPGVTD